MDVNGTRFHLVQGVDDWASLLGDPALEYSDVRHGAQLAEVSLRPVRLVAIAAPGPLPGGAVMTSEHDALLALARRREGVRVADPLPPIADELVAWGRVEARALVDDVPDLDVRRGAGVNRFGQWYWVGADRRTLWFAPSTDAPKELFWPREETCTDRTTSDFFTEATVLAETYRLAGAAVTAHDHLVVGTTQPSGLLVFDLAAGGAPVWYAWPGGRPFEPFDIAPRPDGGIVVLDRRDAAWARLWAVDSRFYIAPWNETTLTPAQVEDFAPLSGPHPLTTPAQMFPTGASVYPRAAPLLVPGASAVEVMPDASVLVLLDDGAVSSVQRFVEGVSTGASTPLPSVGSAGAVRAQDIAYVATDDRHGTLFVESGGGGEVFAIQLEVLADGTVGLTSVPRLYQPLRLSGRRALVACGDAVYYDRSDERWYRVAPLSRPRYRSSGRFVLRFDSRTADCVWHRLLFDGCVPAGCEVRVEARAHDDEEELASGAWLAQPSPYARPLGSEIPFEGRTAPAPHGTFELLFQEVRGRHVEVAVTLLGTRRTTPVLRSLRVYYPRFSYSGRYLPAIYREDAVSASFVERFLANPEGTLTDLEGRIAAAQILFDVDAVPSAWLSWLAGWMGVVFDPSWNDALRRAFLRDAHDFYRKRGTISGLEAIIGLVLDLGEAEPPGCARILEHFLVRPRGRPPIALDDRWRPANGVPELHRRFARRIEARYGSTAALSAAWGVTIDRFDTLRFSAVRPALPGKARDWRRFIDEEVAIPYAEIDEDDAARYRAFLEARYGTFTDYARTHVTPATRFEEVTLPPEDTFPNVEAEAFDWITFVSGGRGVRDEPERFAKWRPEDGASALHLRWQRAMAARYRTAEGLGTAWGLSEKVELDTLRFSAVRPAHPTKADDWRDFVDTWIDVPYADVGAQDTERYRAFLKFRHPHLDVDPITLPAEDVFFETEEDIVDWMDFVSRAIPIRDHAHRFTVLVPAKPDDTDEALQARLQRVEAVVELERPAHTTFDVKLFWDLFRVGFVRVGVDTRVGDGARFFRLELGRRHLAEVFVDAEYPWGVPDRRIVGRDAVERGLTT